MLAAELRQRVVRDARKLGRPVGRGNELEWRIGKREHLLQPGELIEEREPSIGVPQRLEPGKRGQHHVAGNERAEAVEIGLRHEMVEDVDHHHAVRGGCDERCHIVPSPACGGGTGRGRARQ